MQPTHRQRSRAGAGHHRADRPIPRRAQMPRQLHIPRTSVVPPAEIPSWQSASPPARNRCIRWNRLSKGRANQAKEASTRSIALPLSGSDPDSPPVPPEKIGSVITVTISPAETVAAWGCVRIAFLYGFAFKRRRHLLGRGLNEDETIIHRTDGHSPIGKFYKR